jgi:hypothetical protein
LRQRGVQEAGIHSKYENNRPSWVQDLFDEERNFWQNEYPQKTTEEKVKYWAGGLFRI